MFLELTLRRNKDLILRAREFHLSNQLPPNTYVIDADAVRLNSEHFMNEATKYGMKPFAMTKQIGRNPDICKILVDSGITHCVGVDLDCAISAFNAGMKVGHIGHLVQVPRSEAKLAASLAPEYWTVFNFEKAVEVSDASLSAGRIQKVLVRVVGQGDKFYKGHEGGVPVEEIVEFANKINSLPNLIFSGVTSFPATLFETSAQKVVSTPNRDTLIAAKTFLMNAGFENIEINAPGTTTTSLLRSLSEVGVTQVEPGHGLTGTTPGHSVEDLVEIPSIIYVSEISHIHNNEAYVFGGGLYVDPVIGSVETYALVLDKSDEQMEFDLLRVEMPPPESIDYYARIPLGNKSRSVGDTVIFGFRPQVFVTRANTVTITGVREQSANLGKIWAADGSPALIQKYF